MSENKAQPMAHSLFLSILTDALDGQIVSAAELAAAFEVTQGTISRWREATEAQNNPHPDERRHIAEWINQKSRAKTLDA